MIGIRLHYRACASRSQWPTVVLTLWHLQTGAVQLRVQYCETWKTCGNMVKSEKFWRDSILHFSQYFTVFTNIINVLQCFALYYKKKYLEIFDSISHISHDIFQFFYVQYFVFCFVIYLIIFHNISPYVTVMCTIEFYQNIMYFLWIIVIYLQCFFSFYFQKYFKTYFINYVVK